MRIYLVAWMFMLIISCTDAARVARLARTAGGNDSIQEEGFSNIDSLKQRLRNHSSVSISYELKFTSNGMPFLELSFKNISDIRYSGFSVQINYKVADFQHQKVVARPLSLKLQKQVVSNIRFTPDTLNDPYKWKDIKIERVAIRSLLSKDQGSRDTLIIVNRRHY